MGRRSKTMSEEVSINFWFSPSISATDLDMKIIYPYQNLFTLATDKPNAMTQLSTSSYQVSVSLPITVATQ